MLSFLNLKNVPLKYIKFASSLSRSSSLNPFYVFRTFSTPRYSNRAPIITRTYQSTSETLKVEFSDALSTDLHYAWLRDSCQCKKCIHPTSQQKLFDTTSLKLDVSPRFYHVTEKGQLKIVWIEGDSEHVSSYDPYWLHRYALGFEKNLYEKVHDIVPLTECWTGKILEQNLPEMEYREVMQSNTALHKALENIHRYGILFVRHVPCIPGEVVKVMNRIAHIKQTRWGTSFHIATDHKFPNPTCFTHVEKVKALQTDMDYLEKSPGIQATHCLESDCDNNDEDTEEKKLSKQLYFSDGFYAAECLKRDHPLYFNTLASVPVKFRLFTRNMKYFNYQPILKLNRSRNVSEVHFNNTTMAPLEGPSKSILDFYIAYKMLAENIRESKNLYTFTYKAGDIIILNNRRVLHGGYKMRLSMEKHFEGCFADLDEVLARYRSFLMQIRVNDEK